MHICPFCSEGASLIALNFELMLDIWCESASKKILSGFFIRGKIWFIIWVNDNCVLITKTYGVFFGMIGL